MRKYYGSVCTLIVCTEPATELVLALVNDDWWKNASRVLQLASSSDQGHAHDSSHSQALPATEVTIARAKIAEIDTATPRPKYVVKKAEAGPGGRKKLIEGNIGDWKLLKKVGVNEREKDEAVTS